MKTHIKKLCDEWYNKGRLDFESDMYISIMMSIEEVKNGVDIDEAFKWIHQFDDEVKLK